MSDREIRLRKRRPRGGEFDWLPTLGIAERRGRGSNLSEDEVRSLGIAPTRPFARQRVVDEGFQLESADAGERGPQLDHVGVFVRRRFATNQDRMVGKDCVCRTSVRVKVVDRQDMFRDRLRRVAPLGRGPFLQAPFRLLRKGG